MDQAAGKGALGSQACSRFPTAQDVALRTAVSAAIRPDKRKAVLKAAWQLGFVANGAAPLVPAAVHGSGRRGATLGGGIYPGAGYYMRTSARPAARWC